MSILPWLNIGDSFPPVESALDDPNGLLAAGGDLTPERLIAAYQAGIFPWSSQDQPLLWWSPDPRCIIFPDKVHVSRSLKKQLRKHLYSISFDQCFEQVLEYCARGEEHDGGWITLEMKEAYQRLFQLGVAHSVEVWRNEDLVGGLYGLSLGRLFFGESMFSLESGSSKIAFAALCHQASRWDFPLIDCQIENPHLLSLGAELISRSDFMRVLDTHLDREQDFDWQFDDDILATIVAT